jgi:two-component system KDP operon response regulator KdpE
MTHERILIVDSDLILAWDLAESLELQGYEVCTVRTEVEGVRYAASFHPHLVIVDTGGPGSTSSDGVAALQMAVQGPVILLACSYWRSAMPSIPAVALAVVQKPFLESELLTKVAEALDVGRLLVNLSEVRTHAVEAFV